MLYRIVCVRLSEAVHFRLERTASVLYAISVVWAGHEEGGKSKEGG